MPLPDQTCLPTRRERFKTWAAITGVAMGATLAICLIFLVAVMWG